MNIDFENKFIQLNKESNSLFEENLSALSGKVLAIDSEILLRKVSANIKKSL